MLFTEIFTSFQGEGGSSGCPAVFLRLYGCNYDCWFCDENKKVFYIKKTPKQVLEILLKKMEELPKNQKLLIITGGEPFLQYDELVELITLLREEIPLLDIHMETNGSIHKKLSVDKMVVSPKMKLSEWDQCINYFKKNYDKLEFKFLITEYNMYDIIEFISHYSLPNVFLQPENSEADIITSALIKYYPNIEFKFRISTQTHKYLNQK